MTVLNFPASPTTGDTYTENGVLYTWNGSYWDAADSDSFDDRYVEVIGDTMTGQLTLPGGGSAKQALQKQEIESIVSNEISSGTYWDRSGGTLSPEVSSDSVDIGSGKITLNANGLGEFTGGVKVSGGNDSSVGYGLWQSGKFLAVSAGSRAIASFKANSEAAGIGFFPEAGKAYGSGNAFGIEIKPSCSATVGSYTGVGVDYSSDITATKEILAFRVNGNSKVFTAPEVTGYLCSNITGSADVTGFKATTDLLCADGAEAHGFESNLTIAAGKNNFNFFAAGTAPSYLRGSTYIGGTSSRNTFDLWKSTLTEEQLETLEAGTLVVPANVSLPGDGSFARQWYYDQQDEETQALLDSGEIEYPTHLAAATFTDTFALGDNTNINLLSSGRGEFEAEGVFKQSSSSTQALSLVSKQNVANAESKIEFFGANRNDSGEGYASITGKLTSNSGGSGNKQNGSLDIDGQSSVNVKSGDAQLSLRSSGATSNILTAAPTTSFDSGNTYGTLLRLDPTELTALDPADQPTSLYSCAVDILPAAVLPNTNFHAFQLRTDFDSVFKEFTGYGCLAIPNCEKGYGLRISPDNDTSAEIYGIAVNVAQTAGKLRYGLFSTGDAPNYFRGDIECDGLINGAFSLRMQSDDPAAFTTTLTTDEEGNDVSNSVYNGTTEDLLSIIKDLRARVTALEAAA